MTAKSKRTSGFPNIEIESTSQAYDHINALIRDSIDPALVLGGWIKINGVLYVNYNRDNEMLTLAKKRDDVINDHLFKHTMNLVYRAVNGEKPAPGKVEYERSRGNQIGIKYAGNSIMQYGMFKVEGQ